MKGCLITQRWKFQQQDNAHIIIAVLIYCTIHLFAIFVFTLGYLGHRFTGCYIT